MEIYERNINASVRRDDDEHIITKASLLDLNHNMRVEIKVNIKTRTIIEAKGQMVKSPFKMCGQTINHVKNMIGMKIERGITRKLGEAFGRSSGCTHLLELGTEAVRLSSNVLLGFETGDIEWRERRLPDEEFIEKAKGFLANSCLPFKVEEESD
ncbi:DUF2889 domain-containing protein [bacterium]|nr:DUF2889 domain-containing protein [bacterium]